MPDHKTVTFDASQWQLVPKKPTQDMVTAGFESEPDEAFSEPKVWEAFEKLSGCQQAAHKATLCYRAMLEHAPTPAAQSAGQEAVFTLRKRGDDFDVTNITPGYSALPEGEYALYAAPVNGGERECGNADCGWVGPTSETVHPKHDRSTLLCPRCHETTESNAADAQQVGGDRDAIAELIGRLEAKYGLEFTVTKRTGEKTHHVGFDRHPLIGRAVDYLRAAITSPAKVGGDERERVDRQTIIEWLDVLDIEVTDRQLDGLFHAARAPLSADGGDRKDAERYRIVRHKVCIVGDAFHIINLRPTYVAPDAGAELDAVVDAIAAKAKGDA